jgi:hypothetical protein
MRPDYDTVEGIRASLASLDAFHALLARRRRIGYGEEASAPGLTRFGQGDLSSFLILGRWHTDSFGNYGPVRLTNGAAVPEVLPDIPDVLPLGELERFVRSAGKDPKELMLAMSLSEPGPPSGADTCPACGKGWTVADCHTAFHWSDAFRHITCHRALLAATCEGSFRTIFQLAGYQHAELERIPNEYASALYYPPYWYRVKTEIGTLAIGWRKRVIHIDWERADFPLPGDLFSKEDVTQTAHSIHAWGDAKAVEYLRTIREASIASAAAIRLH